MSSQEGVRRDSVKCVKEDVVSIFEKGDVRIFYKMIEDGLDPNSQFEENGCTVLHLAVGIDFPQKTDVVRFLLSRGADPNARCEDGLTPVHISAMWGNTEVLNLLLQMGGDVWQRDDLGKSAFDMAAESCEYDSLKVLRKYQQGSFSKKQDYFICSENVRKSEKYDIYQNSCKEICLPQKMRAPNIFTNIKHINGSKVISSMKPQVGDQEISNDSKEKFLTITDKMVQETLSELCSDVQSDSITVLNKAFYDLERSLNKVQFDSGNSDSDCERHSFITVSSTSSSKNNSQEIEVVHTDEENGVVLLEKQCPSVFSLQSTPTSSQGSADTITYYTSPEEVVLQQNFVSGSARLEKLNNSELRKELLIAGDSPGPVTTTTRNVYIDRLKYIKSGSLLTPTQNTPLEGYASEIEAVLKKDFCLKDMLALEEELFSEFDIPDEHKKWREGTQKAFFNYLLLDPSITQSLPIRCTNLTFSEQFTAFVKAIFYVGKGKRNRPYCHLYDAIKIFKNRNKDIHPKIATIHKIWETGRGVISLHCFQNTIACEAYTREACMIEVLGLEHLTNARKGEYYGPAQTWTSKKKKLFGAFLLYRALHVFLYEGERQIRPADVEK